MYSKIKIFGHPVHPMLVAFPVAFYTAAMVCFIVYNINADAFWFKMGLAANIAGVGMAILAAIPGFIDWLNIPKDSPAKKTGATHFIFNDIALILFAVNLFMIYNQWNVAVPELYYALPLTTAGFACTIAAGFLGWTLVQKHHVGIGHHLHEMKNEKEETMPGPQVEQQPQWKAASDDNRTEKER